MRNILILLFIAILGACRTNNGDIGPLYGQWMLEHLSIDGETADIECSDYAFSFQNNIVYIVHQTGYNGFTETFGTWTLDGDELALNFTHTSDLHPEHGVTFNPPPALEIPSRAVTVMKVNTLTDKNMRFGYTDSIGRIYDYSFFKLR